MMVIMVMMGTKALPGASRVVAHFVVAVVGLRAALAALLDAVPLAEKVVTQGMMTVMGTPACVVSEMAFVLQLAVPQWVSTKAIGRHLTLIPVLVI